jgi:DNA-binding CsgD family transcriptional regulator
MWKTVAIYGAALALAALALNWLEFQFVARTHPGEISIALIAAGFLGLGVWVGSRVFRTPPPGPFSHNAAAQASLGITERELEVLQQLAAGRSNKEIAGQLNLSPNTVKTHIARLYEKLEAARRTDAILRARELGLIP